MVVDDVFGEGITHAIVPLRMLMVSRHAHRPAPSAESMCRRSRQPEVSDQRPESR